MPKENRKKPADKTGPPPLICFIDTEFNAKDYCGQNGDFQEITEIGAVVYRNGKQIGRFQRYCQIVPYHKLSRRSIKITGITKSKLRDRGVPFRQAMEEFLAFVDSYGVKTVYAFGTSDRIEMMNTAKMNGMSKKVIKRMNMIKDIYPVFAKQFQLKESFSLEEICNSCKVKHGDRAHSALCDAEDTARAYFNMMKGRVDRECIKSIKAKKKAVARERRKNNEKKGDKKIADQGNGGTQSGSTEHGDRTGEGKSDGSE